MMIYRVLCILILCLIGVVSWALEPETESERFWPQWRGPHATGVAPHGDPTIRWSEEANVRWKISIPGLSHATPVIWGDHVFILTAVPADGAGVIPKKQRGYIDGTFSTKNKFRYEIHAYSRKDGSLIWSRTARVASPHEGRHDDGSWASCSPVTDGRHVFASFGSSGIFCYDMDGNLLWERDFGDMRIRYQYGESSSLVFHKDRLIVQWDHEGSSFLTALDLATGDEIWRVKRNDGTSWATPLVIEHDGKAQVVVCAIRRVRSYDLETGAELWETRDMTAGPIPSPVAADGIVYLMGGYRESILQAISLSQAKGNAAASKAIVWEHDEDAPYVSSPLLYDGFLYFLKDYKNMLSCFNARTGEPYYARQRLNGIGDVYASPVAAGRRVYIVGRNGVTLVVRHGSRYEVLAKNVLDDRFDASPVIVGRELYLRGHKHLYCIVDD